MLLRQRSRLGLDGVVSFLHELAGPDGEHPVDDRTMAELYRMADLVLLPSESEGFGLPVLEAGLIRAPLVCADIPVLREVAADGAWMSRRGRPGRRWRTPRAAPCAAAPRACARGRCAATAGRRCSSGSSRSSRAMPDRRPRILIPITRARSAAGLLEVAAAILRGENGSGLLLGVVELPQHRPIAQSVTIARRYRSLLQRMTELETRVDVPFDVQVRVASTVAQGVREAAYENAADVHPCWSGPDPACTGPPTATWTISSPTRPPTCCWCAPTRPAGGCAWAGASWCPSAAAPAPAWPCAPLSRWSAAARRR